MITKVPNDTELCSDLMSWVEAFASCAIEGNKLGIHMTHLWNSNRAQFVDELSDFLAEAKNWDGENWVKSESTVGLPQ